MGGAGTGPGGQSRVRPGRKEPLLEFGDTESTGYHVVRQWARACWAGWGPKEPHRGSGDLLAGDTAAEGAACGNRPVVCPPPVRVLEQRSQSHSGRGDSAEHPVGRTVGGRD